MRKRKHRELAPTSALAVDIDGLAALLSCGRDTARKIGIEAEARVMMGSRTLYTVDKVRRYLLTMSI